MTTINTKTSSLARRIRLTLLATLTALTAASSTAAAADQAIPKSTLIKRGGTCSKDGTRCQLGRDLYYCNYTICALR